MIDRLGTFLRLQELFEILDKKLAELDVAIKESAEPDTDGLLDEFEYLVGVGLVAAQQFINETSIFAGLSKNNASKLGPRYRSGIAYIKAIDSAANYWKHEADWWRNLDALQNDGFKTRMHVGIIADCVDYQLSNFLFALSGDKKMRLKCLVPIITEWLVDIESQPKQNQYTPL